MEAALARRNEDVEFFRSGSARMTQSHRLLIYEEAADNLLSRFFVALLYEL